MNHGVSLRRPEHLIVQSTEDQERLLAPTETSRLFHGNNDLHSD